MTHSPRGVLTRVLIALSAAVAALAGTAAAAGPAGATSGGQPDVVAQVAAGTLDHLQARQQADLTFLAGASGPEAAAAAASVFAGDIQQLAGLVAPRTAEPAEALTAAWMHADDVHMTALLSALTQLGVPYRSGRSSAGSGFDCSGLTMFAWGQAGLALNHNDRAQINAAGSRTFDSAQAGDLVEYPGHVMMYLGAGRAIVHAPHSGTAVQVQELGTRRSVRLGDPTG